MEYLLKYSQLSHLREVPQYPDSIKPAESTECPSFGVVTQLLDQTVDFLHSLNAPFKAIHLGGDEVWHMGKVTFHGKIKRRP